MKALIPIADGTEEMEAVILIDTLRRADIDVTVVALSHNPITASRGVILGADTTWSQIEPKDFDVLLLPGGMGGTQAFCEHDGVLSALQFFAANDRHHGSICAAALALDKAGVLNGKRYTCYPGIEKDITPGATRIDDQVVVDGALITSQGPATSFAFGLKVIELCAGRDVSQTVQNGLLLTRSE